MTILDTFYLLFKSDADKSVEDVKKLQDQVDILAAKGKKRNEAENLAYVKSSRELKEKIQDNKNLVKETNEVGNSYVKMAEAIGGVITAYLGLSAIKSGIISATKMTNSLQIQSQWLGVNGEELSAWGKAVEQAGGSVEGLQGSIKALHDTYVKAGIPFPSNPFDALLKLAKQWQELGLSQAGKEQAGLKLGLDEGTILLLSKGPEAIRKIVDEQNKLLNVTQKDLESARELTKEWDKTATAVQGVYVKISTAITPAMTKLLGIVREIAGFLQTRPGGDAVVKRLFDKVLHPFYHDGSAPSTEQYGPPQQSGGRLPLGIRSNNPTNLQPGGRESVFSTPEDGIAAAANQLRRYGQRGINTLNSIISTWAPSSAGNNTAAYIAAVSKDTGFKPGQKLNLNNPEVLWNLINAMTRHENGMNPYTNSQIYKAISLGKNSLDLAGSSPFSSSNSITNSVGGAKTVNVAINAVNIQTQATDSKGIASSAANDLTSNLRSTLNNYADGILA